MLGGAEVLESAEFATSTKGRRLDDEGVALKRRRGLLPPDVADGPLHGVDDPIPLDATRCDIAPTRADSVALVDKVPKRFSLLDVLKCQSCSFKVGLEE